MKLNSLSRFRYKEIEQAGRRIHDLMKENLELLGADPSSDNWKAYIDFVDEKV